MPRPGGLDGGDANLTAQPGILRAFDASNLGAELWDSEQDSSRDRVSYYAKFNTPMVANGKVYLGTFAPPSDPGASQLVVYGLLTAPGFTVNASPTSQSVSAGSSASYVVYVSPQAGFTGTVSLSCAGPLPAGINCSFNPSSLAVGSGPATSNLTISTSAPSASLIAPGKRPWLPLYGLWMPLPAIALGGLGLTSGRRRLAFRVAALLAFSLLLLLAACGGGGTSIGGGGGGGGTQPGNYSITITAADGSTQHTTAVTLSVQ
jgi:hypothetical protein